MRRLAVIAAGLVLVPTPAQQSQRTPWRTGAAPAPTLVAARREHRRVVALDQRRWLAAHPFRVPLLPFDWPARGSITGVYGNDDGRRHPGIDIGTLRSLRIRAAAPG